MRGNLPWILKYAAAVVMGVMASFSAVALIGSGKAHLVPVTFPLAALAVANFFLARQTRINR